MSASSMAKAIPIKRVLINDISDLPAHYSSTPGGTLFSTTPGGSKIVYEKSVLLNLRNSPISKTPPKFEIPNSILSNPSKKTNQIYRNGHSNESRKQSNPPTDGSDDQFQIDL